MTAAAAQLKILNLALGYLGEPVVSTLDLDETTEAARKLLPFLETGRDLVLGRHGWRSAITYAVLADNGEGGDWRYACQGDLPGDCLRLWSVGGGAIGMSQHPNVHGGEGWELGTRVEDGAERMILRTAVAPVNYAYIRRVGWDGLPVHLYAAIAAWAASMGALSIMGDAQRSQRLEQLYEQQVTRAASHEGVQAGGQDPLLAGGYGDLRRAIP